ncbi:MAG: GMP/IMP nucleotidase [Gammaproteobacteria bacterium]|nr:GMP/IMP nucleotidase [Gammaproteobacteria bacterium]
MIDWKGIETVLLDMDGTLLDLHFDNYFWLEYLPSAYAAHHNISPEESNHRLQRQFAAGVGTLEWYCLDHWSDKLQMDIPALKRTVQHRVSARPQALAFLENLRKMPCSIVLVTNAHRTTLDIKMEEVDITPWFDGIVVSHDFGLPKEDPAFWHRLQKAHPFNPALTLLIDDTERVLDSARDYGIAHLLTLLQPDSSQQLRSSTRYPGIHHFDEINPLRSH